MNQRILPFVKIGRFVRFDAEDRVRAMHFRSASIFDYHEIRGPIGTAAARERP